MGKVIEYTTAPYAVHIQRNGSCALSTIQMVANFESTINI